MIEDNDAYAAFPLNGSHYRTAPCPKCGRPIDCLTHQELIPCNEILRVPVESLEAVYKEVEADLCPVVLDDYRCPLCCQTVATSEEEAVEIFAKEEEEEIE